MNPLAFLTTTGSPDGWQMNSSKDPNQVEYYEGLVRKTASMYEGIVGEEFEDLAQIFRFKVWRALESYDPKRATQTTQGYVFSCVRNQVKDLLKKKRHDDLYIEDIAPLNDLDPAGRTTARDHFESQYLSEREDEAFAEILKELPLIPSTLTVMERRVLVCLYLEYGQAEIAETLTLSRREVARRVKSIKDKMADWSPSNSEATGTRNGDHRTPSRERTDHGIQEAAA